MRPDKVVVLLNGQPWLIDFRRNRFTPLPRGAYRAVDDLTPLFGMFDATTAFHHWRRGLKYKDYTLFEAVLREDLEANRARHAAAKQPLLDLAQLYDGAPETPLGTVSNPEIAASDVLLKHTMVRLATVSFHNDTVQLRPSPSVGARHGIEVFVHIKGMDYYYTGSRHALLSTGSTTFSEFDLAMTFICRSDVYMWRYPYGSCLLDAYLDFGHIIGNLALAAPIAGVDLPRLINQQTEDFQNPVGAMTLGTVVFDILSSS